MLTKKAQVQKKNATGIKGNIYKVQRFCINDGPGLRTTVFLKGCQLSCQWCHNPETISTDKELLLNSDLCELCGRCVEVCPTNSHSIKGHVHFVNRESCIYCGKCEHICPNNAIEIVGKTMLLSEVMDIVKRDEIYYSESGGGVTVSGGEPLLQPDFVKALVKECQRFKYSVYIDTNGHADSERFESVVNGADGVLFDLKLIDNQKHLKYTGVENDLIQKNFNNVCKMSKDHIARYVIIPGINDTEEDLSMLSDFLKETDFSGTLELLAYHKLGVKKYKSMGLDYKLSNISTPSEQEMENIKEDFINAGIKTVYR